MYEFLVVLIFISVVLFILEASYVFYHWTSQVHAYLFFYLLAAVINNVGYLMEITAKSSEAAYVATRLLYLGKCNMTFTMMMFAFRFCRVKLPKWFPFALFAVHAGTFLIIITNNIHHLYYTTIDYVTTGLFPHNVYGHGPVYYFYLLVPVASFIAAIIVATNRIKVTNSHSDRVQLFLLLAAPFASLVGLGLFVAGVTQGVDTSNIGYIISSLLMILSLFKYKLIDTVDLVKNDVIDSLDDGLIAIDSYGDVAYVNTIAHKVVTSLKTGEKAPEAVIDDLDSKVRNKEMLAVDDRIYSLTARDMYQQNILRGRLYILDDMTDMIKYTSQIEEERDRADEASRAKSDFLSNMSHEIRTPMNAVVGMTDIMLRNNPAPLERGYLENIKRSGNALLDIINDILDFSKIESGKMSIVPDEYWPLPMLKDLQVIFNTRVGDKPVRMIYEIDSSLPAKLVGDSVRIRQVVINLVNNAIKFTDVGFVRLKVSTSKIDSDNIRLKIAVQDSGTGIKDEDKDKLFDSFSQADLKKNHSKEGTGLGLSITKQLIELMNGTLSLESTYGKGSTFTIEIPQKVVDWKRADEVDYSFKNDVENLFTCPEARILLAEDNEINVKVAQGLFEPLGFSMDVATNGLDALKHVSEQRYDLIFMDHMMPVMDGIEATEIIRSKEEEDSYYGQVPIVALTADAVMGAKEKFQAAGMNDFISKPINMKEVYIALRRWLPAELIVENSDDSSTKVYNSNETKDLELVPSDGTIDTVVEDTPMEVVSKEIVPDLILAEIDEEEDNKKMSELGALDRSVGIQYCGTEELYESVLEDFYRLIDTKSEKIENLLHDGDIRNYTIEVHALKSTARMIGATEMSELAFEMEQAGNANDLDKINANTGRLMTMYRAYKETLSYFDGNNASNDDKEEVPASTIKAELFKMNMAVKDFDMDAVDESMAKLKNYKMPNAEADGLISKLDTLVRDVDFDNIPALAQQLMKAIG